MLSNWLKRKYQLTALKAAEEDIRRVLSTLKGLTDEEMGAVVATSTKVRLGFAHRSVDQVNLDLKDLFETPFPHRSEHFQMFMKAIGDGIRKLQSTGDLDKAAAMMVWHQSMRALVYPEITYLGKEMWRELRRGFPYAVEQWYAVSLFKEQTLDSDSPEDEVDYIPPKLER